MDIQSEHFSILDIEASSPSAETYFRVDTQSGDIILLGDLRFIFTLIISTVLISQKDHPFEIENAQIIFVAYK